MPDFAVSKLNLWLRRPMIVGLIGYAQSGKDTVASRLVDVRNFKRYAFADNLRKALYKLNPILSQREDGSPIRLADHVDAVGWERAKKTAEVRRLLQEYGSTIREIDEWFWVRPVMNAINEDNGLSVITDVRFPNEAKAIRDAGGMLVRVFRTSVGPVNGHVSETALDDVYEDWTIYNNSTLAALLSKVDHLYREALS